MPISAWATTHGRRSSGPVPVSSAMTAASDAVYRARISRSRARRAGLAAIIRETPTPKRAACSSCAARKPRGRSTNRANAATTDSPAGRSRTALSNSVSNASMPWKTRSSLVGK